NETHGASTEIYTSFGWDACSVLVRSQRSLVAKDEKQAVSFSAQEYFAALWSFCALHRGVVVNRPGMTEWHYEPLLRKELHKSHALPEIKAGNIDKAPAAITAAFQSEHMQLHAEHVLTNRKAILSNMEAFETWRQQEQASQYRVMFAESSKYLIQIIAGDWMATAHNELDVDDQ